jgi:RNA polymerase sigma-70 factor (ECF subfamily)
VSPLHFKRLSDESLGSRLASGEAAAFDELYRRYVNRLAAYGSHLLGDAASGDDVAQATMLKAYAALREGRLPERMKPWLFRIAHNAAIDLVVRRRELPSGDLPELPSLDREPFAGVLVEALATLPDRQRRVYVLREVHGLRIDETAAELGLNASQVEQSLFAARNRLAEQLVFGDRLNCVTVQRLAAGPLDAPERRALKTHLRTCSECRQSLGLRGRALALFPSAGALEWLRGLGAGLIGGGAPAAAKVGAIFATATVVGGGSVAVEQTVHHHAHRAVLHLAAAAPPARHAAPVAMRSPAAVEVSALAPARARAVVTHQHETDSHGSEQQLSGEHTSSTETDGKGASRDSADSRASGGDSGDGGETHSSGSGTSGSSHDAAETSATRAEHKGEASSAEHASRPDGSSGSDGSDGSDGSGDHSRDHSGDTPPTPATTTTTTTTTTTIAPPPLPPPPLPTVTVGSGD